MKLQDILDESKCAMISLETFREAFNRLAKAKLLAEKVIEDSRDSKLCKLALEVLGK